MLRPTFIPRARVAPLLLVLALLLAACSAGPRASTVSPTASAQPSASEAASIEPSVEPLPSVEAVEPEEVTFTTEDGLTIAGSLLGPEDATAGVVLGHMVNGTRTQWEVLAQQLAAAGYRVLTIDFRGYGGSDEGRTDVLDRDLAAAVAYLRERGVERVAVGGASMGAAAAALTAQTAPVEALIVFSSPLDFDGMRTTDDDLAAMDFPKLFVCAELDTASYGAMQDLFAAAAEPKTELWLSGGEHGTLLLAGDHAATVVRAVEDFLAGALGRPDAGA